MTSYLSPGVYTRETDFSFYVKQISTSSCGMVGIAEKGPINKPILVTSWEQFVRSFGSYIQDGYLAYAARLFFDNGGQVLYVNRVAHYESGTLAANKSSVTLKNRKSVAATLTTGTPGTDRITWTAKTTGVAGNSITVALVAAGNDTPLSVEVAGQAITVNIATDVSGDATSTATEVVAAITGHAGASALVQAASPDSGVVVPVAATNLAGGLDPQDSLKISALNEGTWGDGISVEILDGTLDPTIEFDIIVRHKGEAVELFRNLSVDESKSNHVELVVNERSEYITMDDLAPELNTALDRPAIGLSTLADGDDGLIDICDADYIGDSSQHTGLYAFDEIDALYYPWLEITDPLTGKSKLVPLTGAIAGCIARSDEKTDVWHAPAGIDRGRICGVISLSYNTSRAERDVLYPEGINVIASFPDTGINIWGQKTLQSQSSATDRINVRRLMMYIEEAISQSARFVVFEPNNSLTWRALVRLVTPFLRNIKSNGGFYDFRVQCDGETNTAAMIDQNQMVCRVFVKPTKTAEFVELNFVLTATGANFTEVL